MANISQFVQVGFTIEKATSLARFFSNVGYLCVAPDDAFVSGYTIPTTRIIIISTITGLKEVFKTDTQYYKDIETILTQKSNLKPNQSGVGDVIVYAAVRTTDGASNPQFTDTYGDLVDEFLSVNGNFARLTVDTRTPSDILEAAKATNTWNRRFIAQIKGDYLMTGIESDNILKTMKDLNLDHVDMDLHIDTEALACADMAVATQEIMGSVGDLYSQFTNITPQQYTDGQESTFKNNYGSYYTTATFIEGGSLDNYAQKLLLGGYTVTGEDRKRRDIRYYFDKMFKARSLDFLAKKLSYENASANILNEMLTKILLEGQRNNLIVQDSYDENTQQLIKGFQIRPIYPTVLKKTNISAYNAKRYQIVGYYIDALTGREVAIDFYVDPEDYQKTDLGF